MKRLNSKVIPEIDRKALIHLISSSFLIDALSENHTISIPLFVFFLTALEATLSLKVLLCRWLQ